MALEMAVMVEYSSVVVSDTGQYSQKKFLLKGSKRPKCGKVLAMGM